MDTIDSNPYSPPTSAAGLATESCVIGGLKVMATCVHRGWLNRTIVLSGDAHVQIRYQGLAIGEKVFVDERLVAISSTMHLSLVAPTIDFELQLAGRSFPARINAYASYLQLFRLIRFSLQVDGFLVYSE